MQNALFMVQCRPFGKTTVRSRSQLLNFLLLLLQILEILTQRVLNVLLLGVPSDSSTSMTTTDDQINRREGDNLKCWRMAAI